ncbi:MAG TPA: hypothetical protein VGH29_02725 [Candidatus Binataceae bacterium]
MFTEQELSMEALSGSRLDSFLRSAGLRAGSFQCLLMTQHYSGSGLRAGAVDAVYIVTEEKEPARRAGATQKRTLYGWSAAGHNSLRNRR